MPATNLTAVIVDDEAQSRHTLEALLKEYCPQIELIGSADGVSSGYRLLQRLSPDVVFLDVEMTDGTGFDLLRKVQPPGFQVVFCTAYDEFAIKAFQFNAVDYILKPIDIDELLRAVKKVGTPQNKVQQEKRYEQLLHASEIKKFDKIALSSSDGLHFIDLNDITRLESFANYTTFHLATGAKITVAKTLKNFDLLLPEEQFFRPHQSHIINLEHVKKILREDGGYLVMQDEEKIPISRSRKDKLFEIVKTKFL
ncbi:MAG: LytTR family DNA-binding domain-containing protein [Saprospiraceae bacterium]